MMKTRNIDFIISEPKSVKWIIDNFKDGLLVIDDTFQRNYVWLEKHQIKLIETIMIGFPIPEIYVWMYETDPNSGDTKYSIVDGQQRFGAVKDFMNNKFKLKEKYLDSKNSSYKNKYFKELNDDDKSLIWKYPFSVRIIKDQVVKDDIIKMFLRLNATNMTLNPQELRKAEFGGLFLRLADEIADNKFWEQYEIFPKTQIRRMGDIQFISSILMFFRKGIEEETTQANINKTYDLYNEKYEESNKDKKMFLKIIKDLRLFIKNDKDVIGFIRKQTHLYTLIIAIYTIYAKRKKITSTIIKNYKIFVSHNLKTNLNDSTYDLNQRKLLKEYKKLSLEGTQKKLNRIRRVEILNILLGINR